MSYFATLIRIAGGDFVTQNDQSEQKTSTSYLLLLDRMTKKSRHIYIYKTQANVFLIIH
jgi:hypothetical protein